MLIEIMKRSPPNIWSATAVAVSVLPTPDEPTNRNTPIGAFGLFSPALAARIPWSMTAMASS